jgi:hypothetical protein
MSPLVVLPINDGMFVGVLPKSHPFLDVSTDVYWSVSKESCCGINRGAE